MLPRILVFLAAVVLVSPRAHEATVIGVNARRGTVTLSDSSGVHRLHLIEGTRLVEAGRALDDLSALAPGDRVAARWTADGGLVTLVVRGRPRPEAPSVPSTPGATPRVPRTNPVAPNPSAPEPGQSVPPGAVPGNVVPH